MLVSQKKSTTSKKQTKKLQIEALTRGLYAEAWSEDLEPLSKQDQQSLVESFLSFLQTKEKDKAKIRVFNLARKDSVKKIGKKRKSKEVSVVEIVNENMPFLVDSVSNAISFLGHSIDVIFHPLMKVERNAKGQLISISDEHGNSDMESLLHVQVECLSQEQANKLEQILDKTLTEIRRATSDWEAMLSKLDGLIKTYKSNPPPLNLDELDESVYFLEWLKDNNFTFLGLAEYSYNYDKNKALDIKQKGKGLGILCDPDIAILRRAGKSISMTDEIQEFFNQPNPLIVTKANVISLVHRRAHLDYIGIKIFSRSGNIIGEMRLVGLFTSTAYTRSVRRIPLVRRMVSKILARTGFDASGHLGKGLVDVLENYPRDELFQIDEDSLSKNAIAILRLQERPKVRLLLRHDRFDRFVAAMVYIPRDRYNSDLRDAIGRLLESAFDGWVANFTPNYMPGTLVRVYFIIGRNLATIPKFSIEKLEREIDEITQSWDAKLMKSLVGSGYEHTSRYKKAFSAAYTSTYNVAIAVADIEVMDGLDASNDMQIRLCFRDERLTLRVYSFGKPIPLSARLPILEHMDFQVISEHTHSIAPKNQEKIFLHELILETDKEVEATDKKDLLEQLYMVVWHGQVDNDKLNALCLKAGIRWRDIFMLRAVSRYLLQIGSSYNQMLIAESLVRFPKIALLLVELFYSRFDPRVSKSQRKKRITRSNQKITRALEKVFSFSDDHVIRAIQNVINSTLRTNFFQKDHEGNHQPALVLKLDSTKIEGLPMPRPFREAFVFGPLVEGVHMRFGKVARGGLRWSDRAADYRTEGLGLVKAQQVKNAVIVPVGAKGCFLPRKLPAEGSRDQRVEAAIIAYRIFIGSLLDITDNIKSGKNIISPVDTVCHDDEDPYLVVAADKGTAKFSDIANSISEERDFWLGDAFASGGSAGYDHKEMAITARGAWESVKRHFREMDKNIQKEEFSVIGVGDMSGDVFGNGMLLSPSIRLVAAFDHRDIFIDPEPDIKKSLEERKRLFLLDRSSWQDYSQNLISKGGGVFSRSDKSITLTKEIKSVLGIEKKAVTPYELITAILQAQVDLLWFGGIGTYIRASSESNSDVGDKTNDNIRITANQLKCKVIGEGANLALTQKARVEFNNLGGRSYSDAIDNSAGVNSSDLEVNIKIALGHIDHSKALAYKKRNKILASMTNDVARLCVANNYRQGLAISLSHRQGTSYLNDQEQLMLSLEKRGRLNRKIESLPSQVKMVERRKSGNKLTRAELGVLLAYTKITLFDDLLESSLPDDPFMQSVLLDYFPETMQKNHSFQLKKHLLRREIIATSLANSCINFAGITCISRLQEQTGKTSAQIVKSYVIANEVFGVEELFYRVDYFDNLIKGKIQLEVYDKLQQFLLDRVAWFLLNADLSQPITKTVKLFASNIESLPKQITKEAIQHIKQITKPNKRIERNLTPELATQLRQLPLLSTIPPITLIAEKSQAKIIDIAITYYKISGELHLFALTDRIKSLRFEDFYDRRASDEALLAINLAHNDIVTRIVSQKQSIDTATDIWIQERAKDLEQIKQTIKIIVKEPIVSVSKIIVVASLLSRLANN